MPYRTTREFKNSPNRRRSAKVPDPPEPVSMVPGKKEEPEFEMDIDTPEVEDFFPPGMEPPDSTKINEVDLDKAILKVLVTFNSEVTKRAAESFGRSYEKSLQEFNKRIKGGL